jgi:hypothetical protein
VRAPATPHVQPISLTDAFNADRHRLDGGLALRRGRHPDWSGSGAFGERVFCGIPFSLGQPDQPNVVLLSDSGEVRIDVGSLHASYLIFLHAVDDRPIADPPGFAPLGLVPNGGGMEGNELGDHVADYVLIDADGGETVTPVIRRFAIQQRHIAWGASPFAAVPAIAPTVNSSSTEDFLLNRNAGYAYGEGECRVEGHRSSGEENLWLYALPNPTPEKPIRAIVLRPRNERAVIYGISATTLEDHPLRPGTRRKLRLTLPTGVALNALTELDVDHRSPQIAIDLGAVISARAVLDYDEAGWFGPAPDAQPAVSSREVLVEYAAHPAARLYLDDPAGATRAADLPESGRSAATSAASPLDLRPIAAADRPVTLRVVDAATGQPVAVRLHLHGETGEYLPPHGRHRKVNPHWFEDNYGELVNGLNQYSYIPGECVVDLPLGRVFVEITRGYEIAPIRTVVEITPETRTLTFSLERRLPWRERGWVTADTHVHFLSPQTALLEGAAEGVNVVNLLASQWGEMFSNVSDFDGRTTLGAKDFGGDGEFLVRVGTENRMQVLGHISLLGYAGAMITPLCTGGPDESALGDPQEVTMAEWAERCIAQSGLVVMPHAPNPNCERAADIVLDLVHAIEMMTFNPHDAQINPYGLADWYRYQGLGYQLPLVGGSDKMSAASLLGGVRTYAHLGERAFTYDAWKEAVRAGNTFVTVGPLLEFGVNGKPAGSRIDLPAGGGTVDVEWNVASVRVPIEQVEVIAGGLVADQVSPGGMLAAAGSASVTVDHSTWIALRVRGSYRGRAGDIAAHSSAVQLRVDGVTPFSQPDAISVLEQIEGAMAYVDTIAPRPDALRYKRLRVRLERAHQRLHARLHHEGVDHAHTPLHDHDRPREH